MGHSPTNQNKRCHCGCEGQSKYDFTETDLLFLGAYLAYLPGVLSEASLIIFRYQIYMFRYEITLREDLLFCWKVNLFTFNLPFLGYV